MSCNISSEARPRDEVKCAARAAEHMTCGARITVAMEAAL
jgi:hypothetical protein